jgi:membrane protein YqaA with SNARE-associated domain
MSATPVNSHSHFAEEHPKLAHAAQVSRNKASRMYDRLHRWAEKGWATSLVGAWAVLQASVVPGPVEALFLPFGLADRQKVWRFAGAAIVGSVLGSLIAFGIGHYAFDTLGVRLLRLMGVGANDIARTGALFETHGWVLVLVGTLTPGPLKLVSMAAGAFGVPLSHFAAAILVGRSVRFLVGALVMYSAGKRLAFLAGKWRAEDVCRPVSDCETEPSDVSSGAGERASP